MNGSADQFRYQQRERVRALARERFFPFYRLMFPTLAPEATFSGALHFRVLARALERVANGETRRLMIAIPPRHGKSLFASVAFPAWIPWPKSNAEDRLRVLRRSAVEGLLEPVPRPDVVRRLPDPVP
jgi:hypothetical protein